MLTPKTQAQQVEAEIALGLPSSTGAGNFMLQALQITGTCRIKISDDTDYYLRD